MFSDKVFPGRQGPWAEKWTGPRTLQFSWTAARLRRILGDMSPGNLSARGDFGSEPLARRKKPKTVSLMVLAAASIAGVVVLMTTLGWLVLLAPSEATVAPQQRRLVVDIGAVAAQFDDYAPDAGRETVVCRRYFDRTFDIDYTYQRAANDRLYLKCTLTVAPTAAAAAKRYRRLWGQEPWQGGLFGTKDVALVQRDDLFSWGEQSRCGIIQSAGKPAGNLFVARKGTLVFYLLVAGACFDHREAFSSLVRPTLARIDREMP